MDLAALTTSDWIGLAGFILAWFVYSLALDHSPLSARTLSVGMDKQRRAWIEAIVTRDVRIADTNILAGLQNGTAFFASTSALGIGAALAVLSSADTVASVLGDIAPAEDPTGTLFEAKFVGLAVIFVYAFFKFAWGYRLFNYASILVGSLPPASEAGTPQAAAAIARTAQFVTFGGRNFNRGLRASNFALAYLGWLAGPWVLLGASLIVVSVLIHRQFFSLSARAVQTP